MNTPMRMQLKVSKLPMAVLFVVIVIILLVPLSAAQPLLQNFTIEAPVGTTNHGDPEILCFPAQWHDILIFFLANYAAHIFTIRTLPGQPTRVTVANMILALFLPITGITRAMNAIFRCARFRPECRGSRADVELQRAARSGALCMLTRTPGLTSTPGLLWQPEKGDEIKGVTYIGSRYTESKTQNLSTDSTRPAQPFLLVARSTDSGKSDRGLMDAEFALLSRERKLHGSYCVGGNWCGFWCAQYKFDMVPPNAVVKSIVESDTGKPKQETTVSCSYSWAKGLIAVAQTAYAAITLYQSRGTQLSQYGYAAFGLTVVQYMVMSLLNIVGYVLTPEYDCTYMVRNDVMEEAERRGYKFDGVIGQVEEFAHSSNANLSTLNVDDINNHLVGTLIPFTSKSEAKADRAKISLDYKPPWKGALIIPRHGEIKRVGGDARQLKTKIVAIIVVSLLPLLIIGLISRFEVGSSTIPQRIWTLAWLIISITFGPALSYFVHIYEEVINAHRTYMAHVLAFCSIVFVPAIGGFITVGQMINTYGVCRRL